MASPRATCLTNLVAYYDEMTSSLNKGRTMDILNFCKVFDKSRIKYFADDSKISGAIDRPEGLNTSQRDLDKLRK
ncbi:hypothetical protein TURU_020621 [Turdus rufiventris]|nr:hypothetical protein TURU_020621 [Turdus rufiventris]